MYRPPISRNLRSPHHRLAAPLKERVPSPPRSADGSAKVAKRSLMENIQLTSWAWWFIPWFTGFSHPRGAGFLLSTEVTVWTLWRHLNNLSQNDMVFFYQLPKNNNVYSPLNELNAKFTIKNVMSSQTKYLAVHWGCVCSHFTLFTLEQSFLVSEEKKDQKRDRS